MAMLSFIAACGASTAPMSGAAGHYTLVSTNGMPVPAAQRWVTIGEYVVVSGSIDLKSRGFYVITEQSRDSAMCGPCRAGSGWFADTETQGGRWSLRGSALTLTDTSRHSPEVVYTLNGPTVSSPSPDVWVYEKQ